LPSRKPAKGRARAKRKADDEQEPTSERRPRGMWSGTLSFGLVTVPVELFPATRSQRTALRMLAPDGTPLARRYFSSKGQPLAWEDLQRGYELDDGSFVVVEDEELERLLPDQSRDIDLTRFVPVESIPPLYFERAYLLAPAGGSSAAYRLLASTMERLGKAGIATFVMRDRQYVIAIIARDGLLRAETLRFPDELRSPDDIGLPEGEPHKERVRDMRAAIKKLSQAKIAERELADSYWQRLEKLVAAKKKRNEDVVPVTEAEGATDENVAEVIDLMDVLRKSLAQQPANSSQTRAPGKRPGVRKTGGARRARSRAS
jgi:DNA end-binding protein Ku